MSTTDDEFIFYVGDESKIVVENKPDKSIFKEVYGNVFKSIDTLLEKNLAYMTKRYLKNRYFLII